MAHTTAPNGIYQRYSTTNPKYARNVSSVHYDENFHYSTFSIFHFIFRISDQKNAKKSYSYTFFEQQPIIWGIVKQKVHLKKLFHMHLSICIFRCNFSNQTNIEKSDIFKHLFQLPLMFRGNAKYVNQLNEIAKSKIKNRKKKLSSVSILK